MDRADTVLFIDARHICRQVDRAHREWTPAQIGFLANLVRLYRGEELDFTLGGDEAQAKIEETCGGTSSASPQSSGKSGTRVTRPSDGLAYRDVAGLCRAVTLKEIEAQGWSLIASVPVRSTNGAVSSQPGATPQVSHRKYQKG